MSGDGAWVILPGGRFVADPEDPYLWGEFMVRPENHEASIQIFLRIPEAPFRNAQSLLDWDDGLAENMDLAELILECGLESGHRGHEIDAARFWDVVERRVEEMAARGARPRRARTPSPRNVDDPFKVR